jgi:hypothetical protein
MWILSVGKEPVAVTPRVVTAWERDMREVEHVAEFGVAASRQNKSRAGSQCPARRLGLFKHYLEFADGAACTWMA